ncbi:hypothetical protein [Candidatus Tisiphia endosymbiont of Empis tessellata]|uniref:hypothetical protein n=1 Tax=Candidatus Tisiphia endosymbiont of Empis tessellata TaxID=3066259 RepID=UPI00313EE1D8
MVGYLVYPYQKKISREIISSNPKFYFFDVGVASSISQNHFNNTKGAEEYNTIIR